ncbi:MAG: helix-turn-helix domain-containing protein [Thaumarchaeota archaeon]|nr:helix-turn-helix domain-containing protein [Nitrososphaerota archaeon]
MLSKDPEMTARNANNIDMLLDVLGNETRRRILRLLADEPRYFNQLSKDLGVSQQAVLKHLEILERFGFVTSFERESDYAAPNRKYFELNRSCMLAIGITKDAVEFVFHDIPQEGLDSFKRSETKSVQKSLNALEQEKDHSKIVGLSDVLLKEINQKLAELAAAEISLLRLRQRITRTAHKAIREAFDEELQRQILYSTIGEERRLDVNELSELLDAREREINDAIGVLKLRLQDDIIF